MIYIESIIAICAVISVIISIVALRKSNHATNQVGQFVQTILKHLFWLRFALIT